jgi:hypothetical protein
MKPVSAVLQIRIWYFLYIESGIIILRKECPGY